MAKATGRDEEWGPIMQSTCISLFSVTIIKYQRLANFIKKAVYSNHNSGDIRASA
jgi:hypothetical protein